MYYHNKKVRITCRGGDSVNLVEEDTGVVHLGVPEKDLKSSQSTPPKKAAKPFSKKED